MNSRLEESDNEFLIAISDISNFEGWEQCNAEGDIDLNFVINILRNYGQI